MSEIPPPEPGPSRQPEDEPPAAPSGGLPPPPPPAAPPTGPAAPQSVPPSQPAGPPPAPPYGTPAGPPGPPPAPPYGAPGYGPPPYGAPPYGTPGYGAPPYGPPPYGAPSYALPAVPVDVQGRPLAEWWQRLLAILIDFVLYAVVSVVVDLVVIGAIFAGSAHTGRLGAFGFRTGADIAATFVAELFLAVVVLVYFGLLDGGRQGQTLGKMALGIATRDTTTGGPIGVQRAVLRRLVIFPNIALDVIPVAGRALGVLSLIWVLVCALSPLWDPRREGFHDKAARTTVVKVR